MNEGYSICLNEWALDKGIKNELGLLLIISSLCAEKGFCWASNEYLASLFDTDEAQISKKIAKLVKKGYLLVEYKKRGAEIVSREIRLAKLATDVKNDNRPLSKMTTDDCQNSQPTDVKNDKDNNTINNNIKINNTKLKEKENIKKKKFIPPTLEEVEAYIKDKGFCVNAEDFLGYFEDTGWVDSKGQSVVSWKGKLRTWNTFKKDKAPKKRATFSDLLREEYGEGDEERNNGDTSSNTDSVFTILSGYSVE